MVAWAVPLGVAVISSYLALLGRQTSTFLPGACQRVDVHLSSHIVGQDLAIGQLVDAVCTHLSNPNPRKPLIISSHGPPGVGKTFTHTQLAIALYNRDPSKASECPGKHCTGAKVVYGMDYVAEERQQQLNRTRTDILDHIRLTPDPLLVIEEYDKLDCASRAMLRQLIQHPELGGTWFNRAIIMLESNMGYGELEAMLSGTPGGRGAITPEAAEKAVKNLIMGLWLQDKCERYEDTAKFLSLVDFFLPYFPLERPHVAVLMRGALAEWAAKLAAQHPGAALTWNDDVVDFLVDRVDFDGPYPLEGAKQVGNVATRYIARLVRRYAPPAAGSASSAAGGAAGSAAAPAAARLSSLLKHASSSSPSALSEQQRVQKVRLEIAPNGKELKLV